MQACFSPSLCVFHLIWVLGGWSPRGWGTICLCSFIASALSLVWGARCRMALLPPSRSSDTARHTTQQSTVQHSTTQHSTSQHTAQHSAAQRSTAQQSTVQAQYSTTHNTAQHTRAKHKTEQQTEYSPALPMCWVPRSKPPHDRVRAPPCGWHTNSVGCAHAPVPNTTPGEPVAPSTGGLGDGNGQRPLARTANPASPSSPLVRPPARRALRRGHTHAAPARALVPPSQQQFWGFRRAHGTGYIGLAATGGHIAYRHAFSVKLVIVCLR